MSWPRARESLDGVGGRCGLRRRRGALEGADARRLDGGLDAHAEVELVEEHLEGRLEDAERAGRPDAEDRPPVLG